MTPSQADFICMGKVGKPIGLKGWLNFWPECEDYRIMLSAALWIKHASERAMDCLIEIENMHQHGRRVLFKTVDNRDKAARLNHATLWMRKTDLPKIPDEEFYWEELIGMHLIHPSNHERMGTVIGLTPTPAYDLLEISPKNSLSFEQVGSKFLPYLPQISIKSIDRVNRTIELTPSALLWLE